MKENFAFFKNHVQIFSSKDIKIDFCLLNCKANKSNVAYFENFCLKVRNYSGYLGLGRLSPDTVHVP